MRPSINIFADAVENKLQRDDGIKPPWEEQPMRELFDALCNEVAELKTAMIRYQLAPTEKHAAELRLECCDVAAYSMMIFSLLHDMTKHSIRGWQIDNGNHCSAMPSDASIMRGAR
jgi:hypothetical protein